MLKIGTQLLKEERWSASLIDFPVLELYLAHFLPQSIRSCLQTKSIPRDAKEVSLLIDKTQMDGQICMTVISCF